MTTIDRCARAIAEVRDRHQTVPSDAYRGETHGCKVIDWAAGPATVVFTGTRDECQHWIDCQAAIASTEALLPDFCEGKSGDIAEDDYDRRADDYELAHCNRGLLNGAFTAAITHIVKEG